MKVFTSHILVHSFFFHFKATQFIHYIHTKIRSIWYCHRLCPCIFRGKWCLLFISSPVKSKEKRYSYSDIFLSFIRKANVRSRNQPKRREKLIIIKRPSCEKFMSNSMEHFVMFLFDYYWCECVFEFENNEYQLSHIVLYYFLNKHS